MSYQKEARTAFANRAFVLSELLNAKFRNVRFSGAVTRVVKVIPPQTESTGGGKMARESIALVPESEGARGGSVVVGWLDVGSNMAELRAYHILVEKHQARFGNLPFDIDRAEYETFMREAQEFLAGEGITTTLIDEGTGEVPKPTPDKASQPGMQVISANSSGRQIQPERSSSGGGGFGLLLLAAVMVGVAIGAVGMVLVLR